MLLCVTGASADERDNGDAKPLPSLTPAVGARAPADLSSAVKACLSLGCSDGHGTAVYLGNGYFITAEHVAEEGKQWFLKGEDKRVIYAEAVWESASSDLALLRVDPKRHKTGIAFPASKPACRDPLVGEKVTAVGNPADIWFAHVTGYVTSGAQTTQGKTQFYRPTDNARTAGDPHPPPPKSGVPDFGSFDEQPGNTRVARAPSPDSREGEDPAARQDIGYWKDAYVFDLPVFPGFSGGPVYSSDGRVLGLVVGILGDTSYSIVEPVAKICDLLPALGSE
jgi:S1-C subfamily serine protease